VGDQVALGREAYARRSWGEAHALLVACGSLDAGDLERLAVAAHLVGRDQESAQAWERSHLEHVRTGELDRAARCAFWLALTLTMRGEVARGAGWHARAERLVEEAGGESAVRGLLLVPQFLGALGGGEHETAQAIATEMVGIARRHHDDDLLAFGLLALGQAAMGLGETRQAMKRFDEVMVAVTTDDVSPIVAGIVYCAVIEGCMDVCDLRRAAEWTDALDSWCASQPDLVPFRGQCLVHRSQLLQAHGAWAEAMTEAERARDRLSEPAHPALGLALYQQAELHRLRGQLAEAERAYRAASEHGREPAPGYALLRLAEGNVDAAAIAMRRMVEESAGRPDHPTVLAAAVQVLLAHGDHDEARAAADELDRIAAGAEAPLLRAVADHAVGCVALASGDPSAALGRLRRACAAWRELGMPYDSARAREQLASACRALGDDDAASLELDAARTTFERLGAALDAARVARLVGGARPKGDLTDRECEVLRLVAAGHTNREIAAALFISEHTVARHLQNMFLKLGLSSRAAATAYAYEHDLV
jgi:ATP/maltotriose-dependent transcriptional regulator MalT